MDFELDIPNWQQIQWRMNQQEIAAILGGSIQALPKREIYSRWYVDFVCSSVSVGPGTFELKFQMHAADHLLHQLLLRSAQKGSTAAPALFNEMQRLFQLRFGNPVDSQVSGTSKTCKWLNQGCEIELSLSTSITPNAISILIRPEEDYIVSNAGGRKEDLPVPPAPPISPRRPSVGTSSGSKLRSSIALKASFDNGTFARYVPFDDRREVIVRRGTAMGHFYGPFELGRRSVQIQGHRFDLITFQDLLSPPVLAPGQTPAPETTAFYQPINEVLYLPDAEVMMRREPNGFSDSEVQQILEAITVH